MIAAALLAASLCAGPLPPGASAQRPSTPVQKAVGSVEWTDPAKDVEPINTSKGKVPGFDIVKLALASDGTALTITATLAAPPKSEYAAHVATFYVDTDNNPSTGYATFWGKKPGFELKGNLTLCSEYDGGASCVGGLGGMKFKGHYASLQVGKIIDSSTNTRDIFPPFKEPRGTVQGAVLSASVGYKDLGLKPGQTVRIVAVESCGPPDETAEFPVVLLTLK